MEKPVYYSVRDNLIHRIQITNLTRHEQNVSEAAEVMTMIDL